MHQVMKPRLQCRSRSSTWTGRIPSILQVQGIDIFHPWTCVYSSNFNSNSQWLQLIAPPLGKISKWLELLYVGKTKASSCEAWDVQIEDDVCKISTASMAHSHQWLIHTNRQIWSVTTKKSWCLWMLIVY